MLDKNPGDLGRSSRPARPFGYTMAHPGKKLLFMGGEFAHFIEWKYTISWTGSAVVDRHPQVRSV